MVAAWSDSSFPPEFQENQVQCGSQAIRTGDLEPFCISGTNWKKESERNLENSRRMEVTVREATPSYRRMDSSEWSSQNKQQFQSSEGEVAGTKEAESSPPLPPRQRLLRASIFFFFLFSSDQRDALR